VREFIETLSPLPIGVAVFDRNLRYTSVNRHVAEIDGLSIADHVGKTARQVLGGLSAQYELFLNSVFETGQFLMKKEIVGLLPGRTETGKWIDTFFPLLNAQSKITNVGVFVVEVAYRSKSLISSQQAETWCLPTAEQTRRSHSCGTSSAYSTESSFSNRRPSAKLSHREEQVLRLLATGLSNKEVAWELKISVKTVECYRSRLMLKLEARSLEHLIHFAIRNGLVQLQG
jgi:DNA-binding CsgD family transcriptional regulator